MEASWFGSLSAHGLEELALVGELLNAVVCGADPDPVPPVHAQRDWTAHDRFGIFICWRRSESPWLDAIAPPKTQKLSLWRELLNPNQCRISCIDVSGTVKGNKLRPREAAPNR